MSYLEKIQEIMQNYDAAREKVGETCATYPEAGLTLSAQGYKAILNTLFEIAQMIDEKEN